MSEHADIRIVTTGLPISIEQIRDAGDLRAGLTDILADILSGKRQPAPPPPEPPTPAGHVALLDTAGDAIHAVVELHAPVWHRWTWRCEGCDLDGHDAEPPEWPCSTVELIGQQLGVELREADRG